MKTIKCKITNEIDISEYLQKYNSVLRLSYNRFQENMSQVDIKKFINPKFEGLNSFIIQNAIVQAQGILKRNKDEKIAKKLIFGGRNNLKRYLKKLISKDAFKQKRLSPIIISGETRHYGNRLFSFEFNDNKVIFKPRCGIKIPIEFICGSNQKKELLKLQELSDKKDISIAVKLDNEAICFIFDESLISKEKKFTGLKQNRVLGIDLNPDFIGISVIEFNENNEFKILHKQVYDLRKLTNKNKKKFELYQINHDIMKLCNYWKVSMICCENLKFKSGVVVKYNKKLNKKCLNDWRRNLTVNNLRLLCSTFGVKFVEINPCYTSQIGNILYGNENTPDMVAASIEVARRGYKKFIKGWFYPKFNKSLNLMNEQWKQTLSSNFVKDWKELFSLIKNSKLKYRVLLGDILDKNIRSFSLTNKNSLVYYIQFNSF